MCNWQHFSALPLLLFCALPFYLSFVYCTSYIIILLNTIDSWWICQNSRVVRLGIFLIKFDFKMKVIYYCNCITTRKSMLALFLIIIVFLIWTNAYKTLLFLISRNISCTTKMFFSNRNTWHCKIFKYDVISLLQWKSGLHFLMIKYILMLTFLKSWLKSPNLSKISLNRFYNFFFLLIMSRVSTL